MVPIELKLRNFMTYREAGLDFQGIHLAVLTGDNGAGKSSLLDAITWALWGKARAKRDDELIHLGQSEMEVEYTFELSDNVYRIVRKRDASGRGRSDLSFQVEEAGGWRTLTETNLRATQQKINQQLRLDYDTFINSSFLLQGRADEFTIKPPGKRKEILSDVLGLQIYELYENRAKQRANAKEKEAVALTSRIEQIEQELAQEPRYRDALVTAEHNAAQLNQQLRLAESKLDLLREQHRAINDKQRQLDDLQTRLRETARSLADMSETMAEAQSKIDHYQAILARRAEIEAGLEQLKQARDAVQDWDQRLQQTAKLSQQKHELDRAFDAARSKIEADLRELDAKINLLSPRVAAIEAQREQLAAAQTELAALQTVATEREAHQSQLSDLKEETARLTEHNRQLKVEMDDVKANLTQLEQAGSNCPVCRRPLDEPHRAEVLAQFQADGKVKGDSFRANRVRLSDSAVEQQRLEATLAEADKQLRQLAGVQGQVARLEQSLTEAETAARDLAQAQAGQADLQDRLANQAFAVKVVAELDEVKAELATLGYDEAAHQQVRTDVEGLLHFQEEGRVLAEAETRLKEEEKRLAKEKTRHDRLLAQTAADREKITTLEQETESLAELSTQLNEASDEVTRLQREERFARDEVAAANQQLSHIAYQAKERGKLENQVQQVREALSLFRELQAAFGKKGIQALLIESAIPEIEDEANKLLSRMTDNQMHIRFETQRESISGASTIETLDIRISDEVGTRDYELYSGGEAFRVNFAIRVAMSKVLARRAGARLQTLVVDEGFGTQDIQGRERLVEAINAIQADFEKIIVITHIDELKDTFPVRIDVWKSTDGSHIAIR